MKELTEEQKIARRYKKFGVTDALVNLLVKSGVENGLPRKASLVGARLALSKKFGQQEYFTVEELADGLGITVEEASSLVEKNKDELWKKGGIAEVVFAGHKQYCSAN